MPKDFNEMHEEMQNTFADFKEVLERQSDEVKKTGNKSAELEGQLERINTRLDEIEDIRKDADLEKRLDEIEARHNRPGANGGEQSPELKEYKDAFKKYIRTGDGANELKALQRKALSATGSPATDGSHAIPEDLAATIAEFAVELSPVRQFATVEQTSTSDVKKLVNTRGTGSGWVGETASRSETDTPSLQEVTIPMGTIYANPKATQEMLDDAFFDAEGWLTGEIATELAFEEGAAFVTGNGTNKPSGFMNATTAATADGTRTFGQVQHVITGVSNDFPDLDLTASPPVYPEDIFIDLVHSMKASYRIGARFFMNKSTLAIVRKLKDADGNSLWQPSMGAENPSTILGYPVTELEAMASVGSNALPVAFANLREAYLIKDRIGVRTIRDEVTEKPYVSFYTTKRVGGKLINDEAIKVIKCAAS